MTIKELCHNQERNLFPQKPPFCPLFGAFYSHFAIQSALRATGASRYPPPREREWPRLHSWRRSGPNRVLPDQPRVNLAALRTVKLLPAFPTRLIDKPCAIPMSGSQVTSCHEHTSAHRLSAWATRGLASHNRVAKDPPHDPDIHSLRQCHAMLRPRTLVRGNEIFGKTDHSAPVEDQTVQGEPEVHARSDDRDPLASTTALSCSPTASGDFGQLDS